MGVIRRVRTPEGARFYGAPIGSPIIKDPGTGKLRAVAGPNTPKPGLVFTHRKMREPRWAGSGVAPKAVCKITKVDSGFVYFRQVNGDAGEYKMPRLSWDREYSQAPLVEPHVTGGFLSQIIAAGKAGGFTADLRSQKFRTSGFAVARTGQGQHFNVNDPDSDARIEAYIDQHWKDLSEDPEVFMGGWVDGQTGEIWLDIVEVADTQGASYEKAKQRGEIAIADLTKFAKGEDGEIRIRYSQRPPVGTPAHDDWMDESGTLHTYPVEVEFDMPQSDPPGTPEYLYRAVSERDWEGIQSREHVKSDGRMNLATGEGTVAAARDPSWYLPSGVGAEGRVLRIKMDPNDGWYRDKDGYWKTKKAIPLSHVDAVTPPRVGASGTGEKPSHIRPGDIVLGAENGFNNALLKAFPVDSSGNQNPNVVAFREAVSKAMPRRPWAVSREEAKKFLEDAADLADYYGLGDPLISVFRGAQNALSYIPGDSDDIGFEKAMQERMRDVALASSLKSRARREAYPLPRERADDPMRDRVPRAEARAEEIYAQAKSAEPEVTRLLQEMTAKAGGEMFGLEHRLKTKESIARKIIKKSLEKHVDPEHYPIGDALRYTSLLPESDYVETVNAVLAALQEQGHVVITLENNWEGRNGYRGVNIELHSPDGLPWELQFHTGASMAAKEVSHQFYDVIREDDVYPLEIRRAAFDRMMEMWARSAPRPVGWETLGNKVGASMRPRRGYADAVIALRKKYPGLNKAQAMELQNLLTTLANDPTVEGAQGLKRRRDALIQQGKKKG